MLNEMKKKKKMFSWKKLSMSTATITGKKMRMSPINNYRRIHFCCTHLMIHAIYLTWSQIRSNYCCYPYYLLWFDYFRLEIQSPMSPFPIVLIYQVHRYPFCRIANYRLLMQIHHLWMENIWKESKRKSNQSQKGKLYGRHKKLIINSLTRY